MQSYCTVLMINLNVLLKDSKMPRGELILS